MSKGSFRNTKTKVKTARGRKNSSVKWLSRHINDPYVKLAKQQSYCSRAAFKLLEIDEKFGILQNSKAIVDLGCAPGSWLQVVSRKCKESNFILGVDIQPIEISESVEFIQGDFCSDEVLQAIEERLGGRNKLDLVLSDMAPKSCGDRQTDHLRIMALVNIALEFALNHLKQGGSFVAKVLRGGEEHELIAGLKSKFYKASFFKPESSYKDSAEIFIVAVGKK